MLSDRFGAKVFSSKIALKLASTSLQLRMGSACIRLRPVSKAAPHTEAPFATRKRPRKAGPELGEGDAPGGVERRVRNVLRGRYAALQHEGAGFWVGLLAFHQLCRGF